MHTREYYSVYKGKASLTRATTSVNLEDMLSEISHEGHILHEFIYVRFLE